MIRKKRVWLILALAGLGLFLAWWGLRPEDGGPAFKTIRVERGDLQLTVLATGMVQPQNRVEVRPPVAGRAEEILVKEGETVRKGQVLALLSSTERAVLLDAASSKGPEELAHWQELYKPTPLMAPLSGVVIARKVEPGQTVTAQDAVLVLSDRLIVTAQVDETDIAQIHQGRTAEISLDAYPGRSIAGRVDHISYEALTVNNVTVYEVDVLPDRVPDFMRSGMTANVVFHAASSRNALLLPAEAVRFENGLASVLSPDPESPDRPVSKKVEAGLSDGKKVEILAGLAEGESVLVPVLRTTGLSEAPQTNPFSPFGSRSRPRRGGS
jgi:macrolide-specific efflux system membrane fusion protein